MQLLENLAVRGMQPVGGLVWIGLDLVLPKRNTLSIDASRLPTDRECAVAVPGLDLVLCFHGNAIGFRTLWRLCGSLYQAHPRRLQIIDFDYSKVAFLKLGGRP